MITMMIKVMSSNIRFENSLDGKHNWPNRKLVWSNIINREKIDILCTQEGRNPQLIDACNSLEHLSMIDNHREWIKERMYPTIFLNKQKLTCLKSGDFWLSETPSIAGSKSFESAFPRLCTWAHLSINKNDFFIFNCHLDHLQSETRELQSNVLTQEITKINHKKLPIILVGDFNESPSEGVRKKIDSELNLNDPVKIFKHLDEGTHHKFDGKNEFTSRIDWILHSDEFKCEKMEICKTSSDGIYPSDHFPIWANFTL